jgi:hypothetical protein
MRSEHVEQTVFHNLLIQHIGPGKDVAGKQDQN